MPAQLQILHVRTRGRSESLGPPLARSPAPSHGDVLTIRVAEIAGAAHGVGTNLRDVCALATTKNWSKLALLLTNAFRGYRHV